MSIIRVKKNENYFASSNEPFNDERLSWEARGVMGYLLSKPDDWRVRFYDLINNGPAGEHKMRRILKELEELGYLERERIQKEDGTFDWLSTVYENSTISRKSPDGDTIYGLSTHGSSTDGSSMHGKPRDILSTESDEGGRVFQVYEQEIGALTPTIADTIKEYEELVSDEWIVEAIKIAAKNNKRNINYVGGILKRWLAEGKGDNKQKEQVFTEWS